MRVLICDDRREECNEALQAAKKGAPKGTNCRPLHSADLGIALERFFRTVNDSLAGKAVGKTPFDGYDVIILDNNLSHLDIKGARLTAESVAGYVRAFSNTPYVLSLNKNPDIDFDLRYLIGDFSTRADLAINTVDLANRALWSGRPADAAGGFRPWYWPAIASVPKLRRQQISFVQERLKRSILKSFRFPVSAISALSRHAKGFLSPDAQDAGPGTDVEKPLAKVTFEEFFRTSNRSIPVEEDRASLLELKSSKVIARAVAGDLDAWFRRDVVGPQDALVDLPHLLVRMPFLLGKKAHDLRAWNLAMATDRPPFGIDRSLYKKYIGRHKFSFSTWVPYATFWARELKDNEKLNELFFKTANSKWGDFVFCEDTSLFEKRTRDGSSGPKEFVAEFEGPWDRRYVSIVKSRNYTPRSRMAL